MLFYTRIVMDPPVGVGEMIIPQTSSKAMLGVTGVKDSQDLFYFKCNLIQQYK